MRLTLRTLLAYMDDILDPADHEELGRKIESSPFATELIHRSRDAVRRLRLSAPDVLAGADEDIHGTDNNFDANTAAEYLDNVLSPEAVGEFERTCLEASPQADMLLAEAASCHHILTMVLGEPAEVDSDLRQRLYALSQSPAASQQLRVEPAHQASPQPAPLPATPAAVPLATVTTVASTPMASASRPRAEEAEIPDYIRAAARQRRRNRQLALAFAAAVVLGGAATWYYWPPGEVSEPQDVAALGGAERVTQGPQVGPTEPASEATTSDAAAGASAAATAADPDSEAPPFTPGATATAAQPAAAPAEPPALPPEPAARTAAADVPPATAGAGDDAAAGSTALAPAVDAAAAAAAPAGDATPPASGDPAATAASEPAPPSEAPGAADPSAAAASASLPAPQLPPEPAMTDQGPPATGAPAPPDASTVAAAAATAPADAAATPDAGAAAAASKPIGHYLGANDMLLRRDSAGEWVRMAPRSPLTAGQQLLALPAFRTLVVLADMNVYLTGGARVELLPAAAAADGPVDVAMHLLFGQAILNAGLNGNRVLLSLVDQERVVELGPSSSLAIDVRRIFEPGGLQQRTPAPAEVTWYLTSGRATRADGAEVQAPATWTTVAGQDSTPEPLDEAPGWVDRDPLSTLERGARDRVAEALLADEPVNLKLRELSDKTGLGRRVEVRTLAARCGTYVGLFEPIVRALGDIDQRAFWKSHIESLRDAIARDPGSVEAIHAALEMERGAQAADDLMEMVLGFDRAAVGTTREEVQQGALLRLLRWMENEDLVYRVLALYNVNQITGTTNLGGYRPEQTAQQRERAMRFYWQALDNGDLIRKP